METVIFLLFFVDIDQHDGFFGISTVSAFGSAFEFGNALEFGIVFGFGNVWFRRRF